MTSDQLPPLNALQVLESSVRNGCFYAAADELRVTPQTVSEQIISLEKLLAVQLFTRNSGGMVPTDAAITLSQHLRKGLDSFSNGLNVVTRGRVDHGLNLNVSAYFADRFLIPNLESFRKLNPEIEIRLTTQIEPVSLSDDNSTIAIQHGFEHWQQSQWGDFHAERLVLDHKIICCSAALMKGDYPIQQPAALCGYPLLHTPYTNRLWQNILSYLGVNHPDPEGGMSFPDSASLLEATAQGLGVGLISQADALEGIASGRLVAPLGESTLTNMPIELIPGFYLVYHKDNLNRRHVQIFCEWLSEQQWEEVEK